MPSNHVILDIREYIATITLNRPEARNALTNQMVAQIIEWFDKMRDREDVRVVIFRGAGDKAFCAGHDLKELAELTRAGNAQSEPTSSVELATAMLTFPKPTIAAVRGYVRQAGVWLSSTCDLVVAAEDTTFAFTLLSLGVLPIFPLVPVMRRIGRSKTLDLVFSCDMMNAQEAHEIGLVDRLVPVERFEQEVMDLALKIASRDPQAVRAGKEALALLADADTVKTLKTSLYPTLLLPLFHEGERFAQLIEGHLASVRGTGSAQR